MKSVRIWFALSAPLILAVVSLLGTAGQGAGSGVQAYSYVRGSAYIDPASACFGETVLMTGTGQETSVQLTAYMTLDQGSETYFSFLGDTMTDPAGNWMLPFTVPGAVIRQADGEVVATPAAGWLVTASVIEDAYISSFPLEITGACATSPEETGADTTQGGTTVVLNQTIGGNTTTVLAEAASPANDASSQAGAGTTGSAVPESARGAVLGVSTLPKTGFSLIPAAVPAAVMVLGGSALRLALRNRNLKKGS